MAALTVIGAGLVRFPVSATESAPPAPAAGTTHKTHKTKKAERPVRYIRLKRGQKAPKGARVIQQAAPTPRVVVRRVTVTSPTRTRHRVTRTRQSGR